MQWFGALILFVTLSAAFGLRCHICAGKSCSLPLDCPPNMDRCATTEVDGQYAKTCMIRSNCVGPVKCCEGDLCNGSPAGPTSKPPGLISKAPVTTRNPPGLTPKPPGPTPKPPGPTPKPPAPTSKPTGSSNIPTGSSVLLLLASSGIITLFL